MCWPGRRTTWGILKMYKNKDVLLVVSIFPSVENSEHLLKQICQITSAEHFRHLCTYLFFLGGGGHNSVPAAELSGLLWPDVLAVINPDWSKMICRCRGSSACTDTHWHLSTHAHTSCSRSSCTWEFWLVFNIFMIFIPLERNRKKMYEINCWFSLHCVLGNSSTVEIKL